MGEAKGYPWYGMAWGFTDVEAAREHLRKFKDMSLEIKVNNKHDFDLLTKAKFKMHGMARVKVVDGIKKPKIYHFDYKKNMNGEKYEK
jgi:hypothetical protein|tara:strand:- start:990 stop:1253 length:264 start_codon:yes stop_codon:yes gene_type:complete